MGNGSGSGSTSIHLWSKSTDWPARIVTWALVASGFVIVAIAPSSLSNIALVAGIALILGGCRVQQRSDEQRQKALVEMLARTELFTGTGTGVVSVPPNIPVSSLVNDYILGSTERACLVIDHGRLVGIIQLNRVRDLPLDQWDLTEVGEIMTSANQNTEAESMART